jgi:two-component system cell cycle response regulator DivK
VSKILYVEDNDDNIYMLQLRLELLDEFELLVAPDGAEGLRLSKLHKPDLILMDLDLPEINGWDATRRLKSDPDTSNIPVIALTAFAMTGDREKALEAGCNDFDTKPIDFTRLLTKMRNLLTR